MDKCSYYLIQNDLLLRKWRDQFTPEDINLGLTKIVAPTQLREKLLYQQHNIPASGHLGVQKTLDRLQRNFGALVLLKVLENIVIPVILVKVG